MPANAHNVSMQAPIQRTSIGHQALSLPTLRAGNRRRQMTNSEDEDAVMRCTSPHNQVAADVQSLLHRHLLQLRLLSQARNTCRCSLCTTKSTQGRLNRHQMTQQGTPLALTHEGGRGMHGGGLKREPRGEMHKPQTP